MPMDRVTIATPRYMLLDGADRIGPRVAQQRSGFEATAIYGFSGKEAYDLFCSNSDTELRPYPLGRFFLRKEANAWGASLRILVLDAPDPSLQLLYGTTMKAVLYAYENKATMVTATHHLILDPRTQSYRVDEADVARAA